MPSLSTLLADEPLRRSLFPITRQQIFLSHAAVSPFPQAVVDAITREAQHGAEDQQEAPLDGVDFMSRIEAARATAAELLRVQSKEIALLGPTALGLSLVANGLDWKAGDEVVFYPDDYPANVYPWQNLAAQGVCLVPLQPAQSGEITPALVRSVLTAKTKLVALASCHFLTGYRLDYEAISAELRARGILFCLDAIQSLGATPIDADQVDFLSADSHKWLLGPLGAGIFYVRENCLERLRPTLLGSWNVQSPRFIARDHIEFEPSARRYEPGSLNLLGIVGMEAGIRLLLELGPEAIYARLLQLRARMLHRLQSAGYEVLFADAPTVNQSGIITCRHPNLDLKERYDRLQQGRITASLRWDRSGAAYLRFSPHAYNTDAEIDEAMRILLS